MSSSKYGFCSASKARRLVWQMHVIVRVWVPNDDGLNNEAALMRALMMADAEKLKFASGGPTFKALDHRLPNMPESQAIGALALGFSQLRMPQI